MQSDKAPVTYMDELVSVAQSNSMQHGRLVELSEGSHVGTVVRETGRLDEFRLDGALNWALLAANYYRSIRNALLVLLFSSQYFLLISQYPPPPLLERCLFIAQFSAMSHEALI